jgi:hypothetical protein
MRVPSFVGITAACFVALFAWERDARADTTTLSPTVASVYPSVNGSLQVVGPRSVSVGVNHSDGGMFCTKVAEVDVVDSNNVVVGSTKLSKSLCNFNSNDATVNVTPFSDQTILSACSGMVGQTVLLTSSLNVCLAPAAGSFNPGVLFTGQQSTCKATLTVNAFISCPPAPPPAQPASSGTSGTTTPTSTSTTPPPGGVILSTSLGTRFTPGKQLVALDPAILQGLMAALQAQEAGDMANVNRDFAILSGVWTQYVTAMQTYQTQYNTCMSQTYTPAQQVATCTATDTAVVCAQKLVAACDAQARAQLNLKRSGVQSTALKLVTDAQALANATNLVTTN